MSATEVERVAGFFFRARMKLPPEETQQAWQRSLEHHREMLAKCPKTYGEARSLVHDCFHDAEIAIASLTRKDGSEGVDWPGQAAPEVDEVLNYLERASADDWDTKAATVIRLMRAEHRRLAEDARLARVRVLELDALKEGASR